ncbi:MAG TPA: FAD-dependent oxidoreductase [Dactylosporangium sp.]|nr:FAD-dependent oxidoreductase [Dactylosporangium sp.]
MTEAETPDFCGAYPRLTEEQVRRLITVGRRRPAEAGTVLIREGQRERDFTVVLAGTVGVYERYQSPDRRLLRVHGPRRFLDEMGLLSERPSILTGVVLDEGEVLEVALEDLRRAAAHDPLLADSVVRAWVRRREMLIDEIASMHIIGSRYTPDTRRLCDFAERNRLPYRWTDLEEDSDTDLLLSSFGVDPEDTPMVLRCDDIVLRNPTNAQLSLALGLVLPEFPDCPPHDVLIIGAGPAGLAAAVCAASDGLDTVLLDAHLAGGQAGATPLIENYPGFPAGVSGADLIDRALIQAERFGVTLHVPAKAAALTRRAGGHGVMLDNGAEVCAQAVIVATGARYRTLDLPGQDAYAGTSLHYAATFVEAHRCQGRPVAIVGGGDSAGQAALFLAGSAAAVTMLLRHDDLHRDMSRYLAERIERHPRIRVLPATEVRDLSGLDNSLRAVTITAMGQECLLPAEHLFVFTGATPSTDWLAGTLELDEHGYVRTGPAAVQPVPGEPQPALLETSRTGVFAVGDVRSGAVRRIAAAVGDGAMAARLAHEHIAGRVPGRHG